MVDEMKKIRSALARVNETKLKAYSDKDKVLIMIQDAPEELRRLANALEKINVTEIQALVAYKSLAPGDKRQGKGKGKKKPAKKDKKT